VDHHAQGASCHDTVQPDHPGVAGGSAGPDSGSKLVDMAEQKVTVETPNAGFDESGGPGGYGTCTWWWNAGDLTTGSEAEPGVTVGGDIDASTGVADNGLTGAEDSGNGTSETEASTDVQSDWELAPPGAPIASTKPGDTANSNSQDNSRKEAGGSNLKRHDTVRPSVGHFAIAGHSMVWGSFVATCRSMLEPGVDWGEEMRVSAVEAALTLSPLASHILDERAFACIEEKTEEIWL